MNTLKATIHRGKESTHAIYMADDVSAVCKDRL